jgi:hypothetical protein
VANSERPEGDLPQYLRGMTVEIMPGLDHAAQIRRHDVEPLDELGGQRVPRNVGAMKQKQRRATAAMSQADARAPGLDVGQRAIVLAVARAPYPSVQWPQDPWNAPGSPSGVGLILGLLTPKRQSSFITPHHKSRRANRHAAAARCLEPSLGSSMVNVRRDQWRSRRQRKQQLIRSA